MVPTPLAMDGFWESLDLDADIEVLARFGGADDVFQGKPAVTRRRFGKGSIVKMAFWPNEDQVVSLFSRLIAPARHGWLTQAVSPGIQAVPRQDGSLFLVNTLGMSQSVPLRRPARDRLTGKAVPTTPSLESFEVLWLEAVSASV
jgi:beta-galactosidase GanA